MPLKADLRQLIKPYYVFNILLSVSFVVLKRIPVVCNHLFRVDDCEFDGRESEILFFLVIVIMIRTRKSGSVSMLKYVSSSFIYTKLANLILWFNADAIMGTIYAIIFILGALWLPQPTYSPDDHVVYFHGLDALDDELQRHPICCWLVAFYAAWSPQCQALAPHFSEISNRYNVDHRLRFGKLDVGRYGGAAQHYNINVSTLSRQLPTLILFRDGKEVKRIPSGTGGSKQHNSPAFTTDTIRDMFDLNNLYQQQQQQKRQPREKID